MRTSLTDFGALSLRKFMSPLIPMATASPQRLEQKHALNITGIAHLEVRLQTLARCEYRPEMFCDFLGSFKLNYFQKNFYLPSD